MLRARLPDCLQKELEQEANGEFLAAIFVSPSKEPSVAAGPGGANIHPMGALDFARDDEDAVDRLVVAFTTQDRYQRSHNRDAVAGWNRATAALPWS